MSTCGGIHERVFFFVEDGKCFTNRQRGDAFPAAVFYASCEPVAVLAPGDGTSVVGGGGRADFPRPQTSIYLISSSHTRIDTSAEEPFQGRIYFIKKRVEDDS